MIWNKFPVKHDNDMDKNLDTRPIANNDNHYNALVSSSLTLFYIYDCNNGDT